MSNEKEIAAINILFTATQSMDRPAIFHRQCHEAAELLGKAFIPQTPNKVKENADS